MESGDFCRGHAITRKERLFADKRNARNKNYFISRFTVLWFLGERRDAHCTSLLFYPYFSGRVKLGIYEASWNRVKSLRAVVVSSTQPLICARNVISHRLPCDSREANVHIPGRNYALVARPSCNESYVVRDNPSLSIFSTCPLIIVSSGLSRVE